MRKRDIRTEPLAAVLPQDFDVWERRDVETEWGPLSSWPRIMLHLIEEHQDK